MRIIRGAINIPENNEKSIEKGTEELLNHIIKKSKLSKTDIHFFIVSATKDITKIYPCEIIRKNFKYKSVPLLCVQEMHVEGSLPLTIRFLIIAAGNDSHEFYYLRDTSELRE